MARVGHLLFKSRDLLFPVLMLVAGFGTRPRVAFGDTRLDHLVDVVMLVSSGGQALRVMVIGLTHITRGGQNRQVWANALVDGMFALPKPLCRQCAHRPGLAIVHNGWAIPDRFTAFVVAYACIVAAEEIPVRPFRRHLRTASACRQLLLRGLSRTIQDGDFDWLKVLRKNTGRCLLDERRLVLLVWEHQSSSASPIG
jgi:hypothetical protein